MLVLFSIIDERWKIADFGCTSEGTSQTLKDSISSRGTAVYRGPELLREDGGYNSKTDIWALGCIAYEFCTKRRAFESDFETQEYRNSAMSITKNVFQGIEPWSLGKEECLARRIYKDIVDKCLQVDWQKRSSSSELLEFVLEIFDEVEQINISHVNV